MNMRASYRRKRRCGVVGEGGRGRGKVQNNDDHDDNDDDEDGNDDSKEKDGCWRSWIGREGDWYKGRLCFDLALKRARARHVWVRVGITVLSICSYMGDAESKARASVWLFINR